MIVEAVRVSQRDGRLRGERLDGFNGGLIEEGRVRGVQVDHAQNFSLVGDRHDQRRANSRVRDSVQVAIEIVDEQRRIAGERLARQRGLRLLDIATQPESHAWIERVGVRGEEQDGSTVGARRPQALFVDDFEQVGDVHRRVQFARHV